MKLIQFYRRNRPPLKRTPLTARHFALAKCCSDRGVDLVRCICRGCDGDSGASELFCDLQLIWEIVACQRMVQVKLADSKPIIPGVVESKSNFIEHPELIAQRIARYANLVGRDNFIAGSDCGFGTWVGRAAVDPDVVWAKLSAMAEGARLATKQFWGG